MDKFDDAIYLFKMGSHMSQSYYNKPIVVTYSGGKDSDLNIEVAKASGEPFEVYSRHTSADAPQTVYHIRDKFKQLELDGIKCTIDIPRYKDGSQITMWNLIPRKLMPPSRFARYCCSDLKESGCENRVIATGVRWSESRKRKNRAEIETITPNIKNRTAINKEIMLINDNSDRRKVIEHCELKGKAVVNPIIAFETNEVWDVLNEHKIVTNPLYEMGYDRVGCVGCPLANKCQKKKEFRDFPSYKDNYIKAFDRMLEIRKSLGKQSTWKSGEEVFLWWLEDENISGQLSFDEDGEIYEDLMRGY